jgi:uncharacterized protein YqjF (DUF2071 family)
MTTTRPVAPDFAIDRPVMRQEWRQLTYVHWPVPITEVASRLPRGLTVDTFDGHAWVGLVPFEMVGIRFGRLPAVPWLGTFPETNVRTYVNGPDGPGVWFDSLDITRLAPVAVARVTYGLPYNWARMSITRRLDVIRYDAHRRWPERGARSTLAVAIGNPIDEPRAFEVFLSARWRLYTRLGTRLASARVAHEPWPLHAAHVITLQDDLFGVAGYTKLDHTPHVMYSPGVSVAIERPRFV